MVVVEEVDVATLYGVSEEGGRGATPPAAVVVTGAGLDAANGLYAPTGRVWHSAPVFENDQKCLLSREPHKNQKGQKTYGWIIGQDRNPLYGIQAEGLVPPSTGWRKFNGSLPAPRIQAQEGLEVGARLAGQAWKEQGNKLFAAKRYEEAAAQWTRALEFLTRGADETLQAALYSNRAEARLRQQQWEAALQDAQAALELNPTHEKALLRAIVAAKELKRLDDAQAFLQRCLEAYPDQPEAQQLMMDVELLIEEMASKDVSGKARTARAKLQESIRKEAAEGDISKIPKAFAAKDQNSKKGFKAFAGYSDKKATVAERPPLHELPHHHMGLPQEQVALMDKYFQEVREKRAEQERQAKEDAESYEAVKKEYREDTEQALAEGRADPLEEILKSEKVKRQIREQDRRLQEEQKSKETLPPKEAPSSVPRSPQVRRQQAERAELTKQDTDEIDSLFRSTPEVRGAAGQLAALPAPGPGERRQRIQEAKGLLAGGKDAGRPDRRTAREKELDAEEAEERRKRDLRILYELKLAQAKKHGEPNKFEQAATEVYAWWTLPSEIGGKEITVKASQGGAWLTVTVRDVVIFDKALFEPIKADDMVWSINDGELHLTLTKSEKNKLWEQLGKVVKIEKDETGQVRPETLPEGMSGGDRIKMYKEMIAGDDGTEFNYEDLDQDARGLVDVLRRYKHALATGDNDALSLAEMDLDEFGKMVI